MGGYYIPKNLQTREQDIFIFSYIHRTRKNLEYIEKIAKKEEQEGKKDYQLQVFEVTQLINSLLGIIVFPMESFLNKMIDYSKKIPVIDEIIDKVNNDPDTYEYLNTYPENNRRYYGCIDELQGECILKKYDLIKHMRNAVCHERISIDQHSGKAGKIQSIIFEDCFDSNYSHSEFRIKLNVAEVRNIVIALCDEILDTAKWTYNIDFAKKN